jgi:hypothetical protein
MRGRNVVVMTKDAERKAEACKAPGDEMEGLVSR